jgi:hypothetical protein
VLGSSKANNVACLAVFDPDTNSALSRQLEINISVLKAGFASERLIYSPPPCPEVAVAAAAEKEEEEYARSGGGGGVCARHEGGGGGGEGGVTRSADRTHKASGARDALTLGMVAPVFHDSRFFKFDLSHVLCNVSIGSSSPL